MNKVLVVGGLGFIGHVAVEKLNRLGYTVSVVDSLADYGLMPTQESRRLFLERKAKINGMINSVCHCDITDKRKVQEVFEIEQPSIVIHLAGFPRQKTVEFNPIGAALSMSAGLVTLLDLAKATRSIKKFVYVSSSMVYGDFTDGVTESTTCNPIGLYGILKLSGEAIVKEYQRRYSLPYTIVRPTAVYGPNDVTDRVIATFIKTALSGGELIVRGAEELLDFTFVDDAASGIVMASVATNTVNKTYNISRGKSRTLAEAAEIIVAAVGKGSIKVYDRNSSFPVRGALNIDAAKQDFLFSPVIDLEIGISEYVDWMRNRV